jgi:hypothetical protein
MDAKTAFTNLANLAAHATKSGIFEMHHVVALHESLTVLAGALGIEPAKVEAPVVPAPANE